MKTAISIPDEVFETAEKTAKRLGVSRSELYSNAVRAYIELHKAKDIRVKLDEIYGVEDSSLDIRLQNMQSRILENEDW